MDGVSLKSRSRKLDNASLMMKWPGVRTRPFGSDDIGVKGRELSTDSIMGAVTENLGRMIGCF